MSLKSPHTRHVGEPHNRLREEAGELRKVQKPAVSGTAVTLGMDSSFGNSRKLFGAKTSKLGNSSSLAKLGMFDINLLIILCGHRPVMKTIQKRNFRKS